MYKSHVYVYMKNLWHCARAYNQLGISVPLLSFVRITLLHGNLTQMIRVWKDNGAAYVTGGCACALLVNKLVDDFQSCISSDNGVYEAELAFVSSIIRTEPSGYSRWLRPSVVIKLQNVVTLSDEIEKFLTRGTLPADVLHTIQQTLKIICSDLVICGIFAVGDLPMDQVLLLRDIRSRIANARPAKMQFQNETVEILGHLEQISEQLPTVEHKMRRCISSIFDRRVVRGRDKVLKTQPESEVVRKRSKSV